MVSKLTLALKTGLTLMLVWCLFLLTAFLIYPEPDNLIVGFIPLILFGVDVLSRLTVFAATVICIAQIIVMFLFGYTMGWYIQNRLGNISDDQ